MHVIGAGGMGGKEAGAKPDCNGRKNGNKRSSRNMGMINRGLQGGNKKEKSNQGGRGNEKK